MTEEKSLAWKKQSKIGLEPTGARAATCNYQWPTWIRTMTAIRRNSYGRMAGMILRSFSVGWWAVVIPGPEMRSPSIYFSLGTSALISMHHR